MAEPNEPHGPAMLCATSVLKPPPARIARIGNSITLPRTVPLKGLIAGGVGGFLGVLIAVFVSPGFTGILYGFGFGALLGVFSVSYTPIPGTNLFTAAQLMFKSKRSRAGFYKGKPIRVAIGVCVLPRTAAGKVQIQAGSIEVHPSEYDERGVLRTPQNKNTPGTKPVNYRFLKDVPEPSLAASKLTDLVQNRYTPHSNLPRHIQENSEFIPPVVVHNNEAAKSKLDRLTRATEDTYKNAEPRTELPKRTPSNPVKEEPLTPAERLRKMREQGNN